MVEKGGTKKLGINYENPEEIDKFIDKYLRFFVYSFIKGILIMCILIPIYIILLTIYNSNPMIWIILIFIVLPFIYLGLLINKGFKMEDTIIDILKYEYKNDKKVITEVTREKIPKGIIMKFKKNYVQE